MNELNIFHLSILPIEDIICGLTSPADNGDNSDFWLLDSHLAEMVSVS
jgi:hypothetical protein